MRKKTRLAKIKQWFRLLPSRIQFHWAEYWDGSEYYVVDRLSVPCDGKPSPPMITSGNFQWCLEQAIARQKEQNGTYYIIFDDGPYEGQVAFTLTRIVRK